MPSQPSRARNRDPNKKKAGKSALAKKLKNDEKDLKQNERRLTKKHDALRTKWVDQELSQLQQHTTEKKAEKKKVEEEEEVEDDIEKELREEEEAEEVEEQEEGEEVEEEEEEEVDLKDLPVIPLSTSNKSRLREIKERKHTKRDDNQKSAVVYLGRLPYGFFEWQMKEFMEQFGEVQRLYISKNKKTGRSRGYGFIEFLFPEVAEIVADTMHDYLMFKKRLVCKVLPQIKAKNLPWPTNQITVPNPFAAQRKYADKYNNEKKPVTLTSLVDKERRKRKRLAANNIDYKFDGYESLINTLRGEQKEEQAKIAEKKEKQVQKETDKKWEARQQEKTARDKAIRTEKKAKDQKEKKMEEKRQKEEKDRAFQAKIQDLPKTKAKKLLKTKEKKEKKAAEKEKEKQQAQKAEKAAEKDAEKKKRQAAAAKKKEQAAKRKAEKEAKQADESTNPPPAKKSRQQA